MKEGEAEKLKDHPTGGVMHEAHPHKGLMQEVQGEQKGMEKGVI